MGNDSKSKRGELCTVEQEKGLSTERVGGSHVSIWLSWFPFLNRQEKKRLESVKEVIQAGSDLMGAVEKHQLIRERFRHLPNLVNKQTNEILAEEHESAVRLEKAQAAAQSQASLSQIEGDNAILRAQSENAVLRRRYRELAEERNVDSASGYQKKLDEITQRAKFEADAQLAEVRARFERMNDLVKEWERMEQQVKGDAPEDQLSPAKKLLLENVRDKYQRLIDALKS